MVEGEIIVYNNYNDIPDKIDHVISFLPHYPKGPHTEEEHEMISKFGEKLQDLLRRENTCQQ
tara:strand:- start:887 stop:1072 length:186 start_codon:yes stop_codon:yes gene_type:complete